MLCISEPHIYLIGIEIDFWIWMFWGFHRAPLGSICSIFCPNLGPQAQFTYWAEIVFEDHLHEKDCSTCAGLKFFSYI